MFLFAVPECGQHARFAVLMDSVEFIAIAKYLLEAIKTTAPASDKSLSEGMLYLHLSMNYSC